VREKSDEELDALRLQLVGLQPLSTTPTKR
jgi:hypothetical protein